jgi:dTDP-4-amino-4,6-dideoxygalactose transaminase
MNQGPWHQEVHEFGINYRLPDVLCALGLSQLNRIENFKQKRQQLFDSYSAALRDLPRIILPVEREHTSTMWHLFPIRVPAELRKAIFEKFRNEGIGVQVNYMPAYWHPVFSDQGLAPGMFPHSDNFYASEISLPMWVSEEYWREDYFRKVRRILQEIS